MPLVKEPSLSAVPQPVACETLLKEPDAEPGIQELPKGFEISIGSSYTNGGIRNDQHDCFGIGLFIPLVDVS